MGFSAFIQYIDKNKKIKVFSKNYAKWTCEGSVPARFYSNKFSLSSINTIAKSIEKEPANEEYWCSVVVPEKTPLSQEIKVDNYLAEIKINGEILKIYDSKLSSNPTKFDFILNSNDKLDIKI